MCLLAFTFQLLPAPGPAQSSKGPGLRRPFVERCASAESGGCQDTLGVRVNYLLVSIDH